MRSIARLLWLAGPALTLLVSPTRADVVQGARSADEVEERAHVVELTIDRGHAVLVVRRTLFNAGAQHDEGQILIDLPQGAVATGLRTLGMIGSEYHWWTAELMDATAAEAKYRELTGLGSAFPKDPALLAWLGQSQLSLQVFPIAPQSFKTVEYTLKLPTEYKDGREHVPSLGGVGTDEAIPEIVVRPANAGDVVLVDGKRVAAGTRVKLEGDDAPDFALERGNAPRLTGALAVAEMGKNRALSHFRLEAPAKLSEVPRAARVVVVLDGSRSMPEGDVEAEVAAARAYLSHFADASAEIVTFNRRATAAHGGFVPVAKARADLAGFKLARKNGSHLDDALAKADDLLAAEPAGFARRIVLLTDLRTRAALTPERMKQKPLRSGALLHIGVIDAESTTTLRRDDESPWAGVARQSGGLVWQVAVNAGGDAEAAAETARAFEELARPKRIDRFKVTASGIPAEALDIPEALDEGTSVEDLRVTASPVGAIDATGELWATPIKFSAEADAAQSRLWSALVLGSSLQQELTEKEIGVLARKGAAVSRVTSYLAVEPGVRPSTEGIERDGIGLLGVGEGGGGIGAGIGVGGIGRLGHAVDRERFLRDALAAAWTKCGGAGRNATVRLETTLDEIVDVPAVTLAGKGDASLEDCVREAAWAVELTADFNEDRATFTITL